MNTLKLQQITCQKKVFLPCLVISIVILLIGLPQINTTHYAEPTITGKLVVFINSSLIIFGIFIIYVATNNVKAVSFSKLDIVLLSILSFICLNRYIIQSNVGFSIPYIELLGLGILYIILRNLSFKSFFWFLLAIIISGTIQAVYGSLQLLGHYPSNHYGFKITGSFFNPGPYAGFLAAVYPISLGMYLFKEKILKQMSLKIASKYKMIYKLIKYTFEYIPILGIISITLVLPATQSRAAWLGTLVSSFTLIEVRYSILRRFIKILPRTKKKILIIISIGVTCLALCGLYNLKKNSVYGRLFIWGVTIEMIKENPVFGVGFDRFKAHYMNYQSDYFVENGETPEAFVADNTHYAFNEWLQYFAEHGLIGLLLLFLLLYLMYNMTKDIKKEKNKFIHLFSITGLLAIGIFAFFSYPMQTLPTKLVVVVLLALLVNLESKKHSFFKKHQGLKQNVLRLPKTALLILGLIVILRGIVYTETLKQGFKTWKQALNRYQYSNYEASTVKYKEIYPMFKNNGEFLMNYGKALSMAKQNKQAVNILKEAKNYLNNTIIETALGDSYKDLNQFQNAEAAYQKASSMIPSRFYPMYLLAKLYDDIGEKEQAILMAKKILNKEIKIPSTAIKEIKAEMKKMITRYKLTDE